MRRKWLFLPDIMLLLFICLTCERREISHKPFDAEELMMLAKANEDKAFNWSSEKEKLGWKTLKDNITAGLFGLKVKALED